MISIVIPTYNEKENIKKLIPEIFSVLKKSKEKSEVIIVDDNSPDGTAQAAEALTKKYPVKVIKRPGKLGLSSAVLDGFKLAKGNILGVMDADLSVSGETSIMIERDGKIEITKIGTFVDKFFKKNEEGLKYTSGFRTLS